MTKPARYFNQAVAKLRSIPGETVADVMNYLFDEKSRFQSRHGPVVHEILDGASTNLNLLISATQDGRNVAGAFAGKFFPHTTDKSQLVNAIECLRDKMFRDWSLQDGQYRRHMGDSLEMDAFEGVLSSLSAAYNIPLGDHWIDYGGFQLALPEAALKIFAKGEGIDPESLTQSYEPERETGVIARIIEGGQVIKREGPKK